MIYIRRVQTNGTHIRGHVSRARYVRLLTPEFERDTPCPHLQLGLRGAADAVLRPSNLVIVATVGVRASQHFCGLFVLSLGLMGWSYLYT